MFLRRRPLARLSARPLSAFVPVPVPVPVSPASRWQHARFFHPSQPQHSVLESCLHASNDLFLFVRDTTGLAWGASSFLTGIVARILFAPGVLWSELPTHQYNRMGRNMLLAQERIIRKQYKARSALETAPSAMSRAQWIDQDQNHRMDLMRKKYTHARHTKMQRFVGNCGFLPIWLINMAVITAMCTPDSSFAAIVPFVPTFNDPSLEATGGWSDDLSTRGFFLLVLISTQAAYLDKIFPWVDKTMKHVKAIQTQGWRPHWDSQPPGSKPFTHPAWLLVIPGLSVTLIAQAYLPIWTLFYLHGSVAGQYIARTITDMITLGVDASRFVPRIARLKSSLRSSKQSLDVFDPSTHRPRKYGYDVDVLPQQTRSARSRARDSQTANQNLKAAKGDQTSI